MLKKYPIAFYTALTATFSMLPYVIMYRSGNAEDDLGTFILMWMPALAAIVHRFLMKEPILKGAGWNPLKSLFWLSVALLLPLVVSISAVLFQTQLGFIVYNTDFISQQDGLVEINGIAMLFGAKAQPMLMFLGNFLLSFLAGNILYTIMFALGEEFGWRAHLQPLLMKRFTQNQAFVVLGIIWGLWHFPGVLLGKNFPEYPVLGGLIMMPVTCIAFSFAFGIAYRRAQSVWVPALFHSAINLSSGMDSKMISSKLDVFATDLSWTGFWILAALTVYFFDRTFPKHASEKSEIRIAS